MMFKSELPDVVISKVPVGTRLLQKLETYGDRVALINGNNGKEITYVQLRNDVIKYAAVLSSLGVRKGDLILLIIPLDPSYVPLLIAISICGAIFTFSQPSERNETISLRIKAFQPYFIVAEKYAFDAEISCPIYSLEKIRKLQTTFDLSTRRLPMDVIIDIHKDPIAIFNSNGTTGISKGIVYTHYSMNAYIDQDHRRGFEQRDCILLAIPQYDAWVITLLYKYLIKGVKLVIVSDITLSKMCCTVSNYKVSKMITCNVPVLVDLVLKTRIPELETLKVVYFGGMIISPEIKNEIERKQSVLMLNDYGLNENGQVAISSKTCPKNSVGKLVSNVQVRIVDLKSGLDLGYNQRGEILIRSPSTMKGYFKPQGDDIFALDSENWLHTGDSGYFDENEYLYIDGRIKHVIKGIGGISLYPAEIESILSEHPHVKDVAVIGVRHPKYSEVVKAFVVRGHESADPEEILAFYNDQVSENRKIRGGIEFIDVLPRIGIGKFDRKKLMEQHNKSCNPIKSNGFSCI